ncbi:hypothetical protein GOBAR_DD22517 [Gossypium barbadense]|nr:hypothetical protein GOBAR_DD22517 [Gossypium barbadense]
MKICPASEVKSELIALRNSNEAEKADEQAIGDNLITKLEGALSNVVVRRGLHAGVAVQVAPTIIQFAGFASNKIALVLSLVMSTLNAVVSMSGIISFKLLLLLQ